MQWIAQYIPPFGVVCWSREFVTSHNWVTLLLWRAQLITMEVHRYAVTNSFDPFHHLFTNLLNASFWLRQVTTDCCTLFCWIMQEAKIFIASWSGKRGPRNISLSKPFGGHGDKHWGGVMPCTVTVAAAVVWSVLGAGTWCYESGTFGMRYLRQLPICAVRLDRRQRQSELLQWVLQP